MLALRLLVRGASIDADFLESELPDTKVIALSMRDYPEMRPHRSDAAFNQLGTSIADLFSVACTTNMHEFDLRQAQGNGDFKARDNSAKISSTPELVSAETTTPTAQPASSAPFGAKREIPKFERVRGGPGRSYIRPQRQAFGS